MTVTAIRPRLAHRAPAAASDAGPDLTPPAAGPRAEGGAEGHGPRSTAVTVVIATRNRVDELLSTLDRLCELAERPAIVVVDNASADGTADAVAARHPCTEVVPLASNAGAAARTVGARCARTTLVAFVDEDSWWAPGSLVRAAQLFAARPRLGLVAARVVVEPMGTTDPTSEAMARSPLGPPLDLARPSASQRETTEGPRQPRGDEGLRQVVGFLACGAVVRREAFLGAGGILPELVIGGEGELLSIDLATAGWEQLYAPDVVAHHHHHHHHHSSRRSPSADRRHEVRNALWIAWARRRPWPALRRSLALLRAAGPCLATVHGVADALGGAGWVVRHRAVVPPAVEWALATVERDRA